MSANKGKSEKSEQVYTELQLAKVKHDFTESLELNVQKNPRSDVITVVIILALIVLIGGIIYYFKSKKLLNNKGKK